MPFNDFIELELPKRPFTEADGLPMQIPVRSDNPLAPREMVWKYLADLIATSGAGVVPKFDLPAAGPISGHRALAATGDGHVRYASSAVLTDAHAVLGISLNAAADGAMVSIQHGGQIVEPSWNWTPQQPIFCGENGVLTQTAPTAGFVLIIATALSPTAIAVGIKQPIVIT